MEPGSFILSVFVLFSSHLDCEVFFSWCCPSVERQILELKLDAGG